MQLCSLSAHGLWIGMLCLMHEADPYGHLVAAGKAIDHNGLARLVGETPKDVRRWLDELQTQQVFSVTDAGVIYSRRMIKDEKERQAWGDRQRKHRDKTSDKERDNPSSVTPESRENTTLSSSSSSSSASTRKTRNTAPPAPPDGVDPAVWVDWLKIRKAKRLPWTDTAWQEIQSQIAAAGLSVPDGIRVCCARGWASFRADWYAEHGKPRNGHHAPQETAHMRNVRERMEQFAPDHAARPKTPPREVIDVSARTLG